MNVETATLTEIQKIQSDLRILRLALDAVEAEVEQLLSKQQKVTDDGRPTKLTDLEGIWAGADFSYEEIKAAEYKVPEDLL